jgi:uncharacterized protein (DUF1697 family)
MPTYIALLRAVNVGGTGKLPMADFRKLLSQLGFRNVETYIQSGNAVFDAPGSPASVTKSVSTALATFMGKPVPVLVRGRDDLSGVIAANPFAAEAEADGARVHVVFLSARPAKPASAGLDRIVAQYPARRDRYYLAGDTLYLHLPDGAADSKFTAVALDRILGVTATARNWNTVLKLHAMAQR